MNEQDIEYVIAHEKAHLKRHDHWWKPLGFLLLTVYWFNPILWIAYILLCKDIELACDEKVIKDMGTEIKKPYSDALINCSVPRKMISACPLAFGEVGVKGRVKSVLNYKKPAFWIIVVAVIACIALSVGFLTNPATKLDTNMASFIEEQIIEYHHGGYKSGEFYCTDFKVLGTEKDKENTTVYMWVLYSEYDKVNGKIEDVSGAHIPTVITVKKTGSSQYELVEYWEPRDGSYYAEDIKDKFPWYLHGKALDSQRYIKEQQENCNRKAQAYFASSNSINTEFEGVYISLESYNTDEGGQTHFNVVWHNETNSEITFGESFSIEQKTGTEWKDAEFDEDEVFHLIGILLKPQSTENKTYITEHYDLSKAGTYRLVLPFSVKDGDNYKQYKTWAEFNVEDLVNKPPMMTVTCGKRSVNAWLGTYSWMYKNFEDGTAQSTNADSSHPLTRIDEIPILNILPTTMSSIDPHLASLQFSVAPDKIEVTCYKLDDNVNSKGESISVNGTSFKLKEGEFLYEVIVEWTESERYNGKAYYAFQTYESNLEFEVEKADDWGITVGMLFTSATEFDIVINQSSEKQIATGTYTTSPEYELRAIYNGSAIPFGDYMRAVLNKEYDDPELAWDTVLYDVKPDKELKIKGDFSTTYGELPVGQYELWKPITLTTEDGTQSQKVYTVQFAITD